MTFTHHCSECGNQVDEFCAEHPEATVESVYTDIESLIAPARAAIARSEEYGEIVTIEGTPAIHSFLLPWSGPDPTAGREVPHTL